LASERLLVFVEAKELKPVKFDRDRRKATEEYEGLESEKDVAFHLESRVDIAKSSERPSLPACDSEPSMSKTFSLADSDGQLFEDRRCLKELADDSKMFADMQSAREEWIDRCINFDSKIHHLRRQEIRVAELAVLLVGNG
jgi:hypothetical protein